VRKILENDTTNNDKIQSIDQNLAVSLALKTVFGFNNFRVGQIQAIDRFLANKDVFIIMPTGGGKSLCYALPSILFAGLTVVFTLLVALIEDQVGQLRCLKKLYSNAPIMMLTATCSQTEFDDIKSNLNISQNNLEIIRAGDFSRLEISYEVRSKRDSKDENIINIVEEIRKISMAKCIVYCSTPFECEEVSTALGKILETSSLSIYHGEMPKETRKYSMSQWQKNQIQIMIATSAFGMGIDMPDVKLVIHYTFPKSITNLIQETGRAGRNGNDTTTIIYFSQRNLLTNSIIVFGKKESQPEFSSDTNEVTILNREKRLSDAQQKLFEVLYYLNEKYECRRQMLLRYHSWDVLQDSSNMCGWCDNCQRHITDQVQQVNATNEVERILHIIETVLIHSSAEVVPDNIVDIFLRANNAKIRARGYDQLSIYNIKDSDNLPWKPKILKTKELVKHALQEMVILGLVRQVILLRRYSPTSTTISHKVVVTGIAEDSYDR
ncbi:9365_t:CDS:2, partial [Ambispora gerdemannii]